MIIMMVMTDDDDANIVKDKDLPFGPSWDGKVIKSFANDNIACEDHFNNHSYRGCMMYNIWYMYNVNWLKLWTMMLFKKTLFKITIVIQSWF